MNDRQRLWRSFRRKWLQDDAGAQTHEPAWTTPELPLSIWPARRRTRRIVFLSKTRLYDAWLERSWTKPPKIPPDWTIVSRIGFPDEPQLAVLASLHKLLRVPWCFIGDLDPLDLTAFLAIRALSVDFVGRRPAIPMTWVGISDVWLKLCRKWLDPGWSFPIKEMNPLEPEHWRVLRVVAPELPAIIGPECTRLLDAGQTLDVAGAINFYKPGFVPRLFKLLVTTVQTTRHP